MMQCVQNNGARVISIRVFRFMGNSTDVIVEQFLCQKK